MSIRYFDIKRHWTKKIEPHLTDPTVSKVLVRDFNKYTFGRWRQRFLIGDVPAKFETCLWDIDCRGKRPRFFDYVKHAACHWLVNFNLRLAEASAPTRPWRILTSQLHSTVFDGTHTLFDMNFLAMGVPPAQAFSLATHLEADPQELIPGRELKVYMASHFSKDRPRHHNSRST